MDTNLNNAGRKKFLEENQDTTSRYQDQNKNEVKFLGKISADIKHGNNKQKTQILVSERNDIKQSDGER